MKKKSTDSQLTIMILPGDASRAKKYRVSERRYKLLRNAFFLFMGVCVLALFDYGSMRVKVAEYTSVKKENTSQRIELQTLTSKIDDLETHLSKLRLFDKKIRIMANLEAPAAVEEELMGMGGASSDDYLLTLEGKRDDLVGRLHADLTQLESEAMGQEESFTELQEYLLKQTTHLASTPSVWPTRGWATSSYGKRRDPFTGRIQVHKGLDIANRVGTSVITPADGIVTRVTRTPSLGKLVDISHGYGIKTRYAHLSEVLVKVGHRVKRGDKIAAMGNTGRSTGPHLHYEVVVNGVNVNPHNYILN